MGLAIARLPTPRREELFDRIQERRVWGRGIECDEKRVTCEPIVDRSSPVETNIAPDDNVAGLPGPWSLGISLMWRVSRNVIMCAVLYGPRIA